MNKPSHKLARLFTPRSIAFVGGDIAAMAIRRSVEMGYQGEIWPVNPTRESMEGFRCFRSIEDLPSAPDAAHVDVNRHVTVDIVRRLSQAGAGGAVCYAAGFAEMGAQGKELEDRLIEAAGSMPLIGPNSFGFLNFASKGPFAEIYAGMAGNVLVDWMFMIGLLAVGLPLLLGIGVKLAGYAGVLILVLMYTAGFILPENNPFLDEHIIYAVIMIGLTVVGAGRWIGMGNWWADRKLVRRYPILE